MGTRLSTNFADGFFHSLIEWEKRDTPPAPSRKVWTKIQWWHTLPHMHRRRSTQSSGALRDTRTLFPSYWTRCGSIFIWYFDWNHHKRFTCTKVNSSGFLWAPQIRNVRIDEIIFILDVVAACRLSLLSHIKRSIALGAMIMAGGRSKVTVWGAVNHVRVHYFGCSVAINSAERPNASGTRAVTDSFMY